MSFLSYKHIRHLGYDEQTNLYSNEYEITDSEWIDVEVGVSGALGPEVEVADAIGLAVINAYEKRELLLVAPNLFLAFQYIAKRYGWTVEEIINYSKQYNHKYPKYEQEVQKYLMLI